MDYKDIINRINTIRGDLDELEKMLNEKTECEDNSPRWVRGEELIGRKIKEGTKFRVINVEPHKIYNFSRKRYVCLDEYIGKEGVFYSSFTFHKKSF